MLFIIIQSVRWINSLTYKLIYNINKIIHKVFILKHININEDLKIQTITLFKYKIIFFNLT